ncbi:hypothetical protein MRY87_00660 [bacterium]|nr:hypothetical protein [bacterium]
MLTRLLVVLISALLLSHTAIAQQAARFDVDSDGLSEITLLSIDSEGNVDWQLLSSSSEYSTSLSDADDFGTNGVGVAAADWDGDGAVEFAHVRRVSGQNKLRWTVQSGGDSETLNFGARNALAIAGFDIDGDGADAVTVQKNGRVAFILNPFAGGSQVESFRLPRRWTRLVRGGKAEAGYYTDSDGAYLVVAYRSRGRAGRYRVGIHNFRNGSQSTVALSSVPRGRLIEVVEILGGDGEPRLLLHEQLSRSQARVRIFSLDGDLLFGDTYSGNAVIVGSYISGATGEQFAVQNGTSLQVVAPFGGTSGTITVPSGIVADLANINQFSANAGSGGSGGGGSNPGLSSVCPNISDFGGGKLWKPDSDVSDNRGGKPVLLLTGGNKTSRGPRKVYDSQGNVVCSGMTFKSSSIPGVNKGADHYYAGWVGGCSLSGGQMAARARANTGSSNVWVQWKTNSCLRVGNPDERHGGI